MTILWCGGEDVDFIKSIGGVIYAGALYNSSFARCGISESYEGVICYGVSTFTPMTSLWVHCNSVKGFGSGNYKYLFGLLNNTTKYGLFVRIYESTNLAIVTRGVTETLLVKQNAGLYVGGTLDLQVLDYGSNGTVNLYQEGSLVLTYTGNISVSGCTELNMAAVGGPTENNISEVIVADEDTRLMRLKTCSPNAAGDSSTNWTGAYTDIDETTISTTDKLQSTTDNADFQCNLTGMPTGSYRVKAVKTVVYALDGKGDLGVQLGVKTNSTVSVGTTQTCSGYWTPIENLMTVNPVTGLEWTPAEIDALQLNIRAKVI